MGKYEKIRDAEPDKPPPPARRYFGGDERSAEAKAFIQKIVGICKKHGFVLVPTIEDKLHVFSVADYDAHQQDMFFKEIADAEEYRR